MAVFKGTPNVSAVRPLDPRRVRGSITLNGGQIVNVDRKMERRPFRGELNFANCHG